MIVLRNKYFGPEAINTNKKTFEELLMGSGLYHPYLKRAAIRRLNTPARQKTGLGRVADCL